MPIPKPSKNEKEKDFISRCMSILADDYKDNKQRAAVCYSAWKDKKKESATVDFDIKIKESKLISRNSKKNGKSQKRIVVGYAATYDVFTNGDTLQITRQAIEEAKDDLLEYNTVLFNHDQDRPIGTIVETAADDKGLLIKFVLSNSENEIWTKVQDGTISKLSFQAEIPFDGYEIIESLDKCIFQVKKIRFFEAGLVSIPGNGAAETLATYVEHSLKEHKENKEKVMLEDQERCEDIISELERLKEKMIDDDSKLRIDEILTKMQFSKQILADLQILSGKLAEEDRKVIEIAVDFLKNMIKKEKLEEVEKSYDMSDESDSRPVFQLNLTDPDVEFDENTPSRFKKQVLKFGKWFHWNAPGGMLKIDENIVDKIIENFKKKRVQNVFVPLTHTDDPSKNTGTVVDLIKTDKGLDAVIEIKDESIAEKIKKGLISCVSASIDPNYRVKKTNEFVGTTLLHTALVAEPYIKGMNNFIPLTDEDFSARPILMLEDEEPDMYKLLKSMNDKLNTIESAIKTDTFKKNMDETTKKDIEEVKVEDKKEEITIEEKKEEIIEEAKEETVVEDKVETLDIEAAKKAKDDYKVCMADEMKKGTEMAEATKKCKGKIKENFGVDLSDTELEIKSEEVLKVEVEIKQEVNLADVEKKYDEYLHAGKIVPAQKEAFINLFSSLKKIELSDNTVGVTDLIDSFMKSSPKIVNFEEAGTAAIPSPLDQKPVEEEIPADVKEFYGEKMGMSEDKIKKSWETIKKIKAEEDANKGSSIF